MKLTKTEIKLINKASISSQGTVIIAYYDAQDSKRFGRRSYNAAKKLVAKGIFKLLHTRYPADHYWVFYYKLVKEVDQD